MPPTVRYCRGCNAQFAVAEGDPRCPQCHVELGPEDVAPTLDLDATVAYDAGDAPSTAEVDLPDALVGSTFADYTVESFLGKGGMAWVFLATHRALCRPCALKILSPTLRSRSLDFLDLFVSEARAAASVVHPNIVAVHNIGEAQQKHFIEMEYVPGRSLQWVVEEQGRLPCLEAIRYLVQVAGALAEAHRCGLVHRDFKPSNVLVRADGVAKLADFGLAKRIDAGGNSPRAGRKLQGTPHFMAPELFFGRAATKQSDVYAVGVSLFYLLAGEFPFVHKSLAELAVRHAEEPVPDVRRLAADVPDDIVALVGQCLAKDPGARPHDAAAVHERLRGIFGTLRDFGSLVAEAFAPLGVTWKTDDRRVEVSVPLPEGRRQTVYVEDTPRGRWAEPVIRIFSICAAADESYDRAALELNAGIAHGALAVEDLDGQPHFVMVNSYPRTTCDAEEIRKSVLEVGRRADEVEKTLTGKDCH